MSIEQKVKAFLSSAAGQAKIESLAEVDVTREVLNLENAIIQEQGELPFSFEVSNGDITFSSAGGITKAECEIEFNHQDAERTAFWSGGKWPSADLIFLFDVGYSYSSDHPPTGIWHGRRTVAQTNRAGRHFVRNAVDRYLSSAPAGVEVEIDGSYT